MRRLDNKKIKEDLLNEIEIDKKFTNMTILLMVFLLFIMLFLAKDIFILLILSCIGIAYTIYLYCRNAKRFKDKIKKINTGEINIKEFKLIDKKEEYNKKRNKDIFILKFEEDIDMYISQEIYKKSKINDIFYIIFINDFKRPELCYNKKSWNLIK